MKLSKFFCSFFVLFCFLLSFLLLETPLCELWRLPSHIEVSSTFLSDYIKTQNSKLITTKFNKQSSTIDYYLCNALKIKSVEAEVFEPKKVFLGGDALGFEYNTKGVLVLGKNKVFDGGEFFDNLTNNEIVCGDVITEIDGFEVNNALQISEILNNEKNAGTSVCVKAIRKGKAYQTQIKPAYDLLTKKYKLGAKIVK